MLQRAGIAQAILHDPPVVILDEPMSGLDPVGRREVRDIILDLKKQGRTVFFSTHILSDAEMLCDRVAVLAGGKLQGVGAPRRNRHDEVACNGNSIRDARGTCVARDAGRTCHANRRALPRGRATKTGLYAALEQLRGCEARILSVSPVHPTLEDYFLPPRGCVQRRRAGSRRYRDERDSGAGGASTRSAKRCATACFTTWCCSRC